MKNKLKPFAKSVLIPLVELAAAAQHQMHQFIRKCLDQVAHIR